MEIPEFTRAVLQIRACRRAIAESAVSTRKGGLNAQTYHEQPTRAETLCQLFSCVNDPAGTSDLEACSHNRTVTLLSYLGKGFAQGVPCTSTEIRNQ